jgi:acetylornithine/N-succinyldiaminopimelate aminotransferase
MQQRCMHHLLRCHPINGINFVRGENCALFDENGRRFVDLESGSWAAVLGHAHPEVNATLHEQLDRVMHLGVRCPNGTAEAAAVDVLELVGMSHGRCTFLSSGSEAVEFGVQAARRLSERPLLLTFSDSYLAAFGSAGRKDLSEWHLANCQALAKMDPAEALATIPFERIGGFVFEPGGGSPGFVRFPPAALVEAIADRVQADGGLLVCNEVTTGMGRTGRWFGYQHYRLSPDVVALGKGLGNGYPVSAVAIRGELAERLERGGLHHAQSHQNNPLGCAVARTVIRVLRDGNWIERGAAAGARLIEQLRELQRRHPAIREVRGRGMLIGLEFAPEAGHSGSSVHAALWERGLIAGCYPAGHPAGTGLRFDPSLTIDDSDLERLVECLGSVLGGAPAHLGRTKAHEPGVS